MFTIVAPGALSSHGKQQRTTMYMPVRLTSITRCQAATPTVSTDPWITGGVHDAVDATHCGCALLDGMRDRRLLRDIRLDGHTARLPSDFRQSIAIAIEQRQRGAFRCEQLCGLPPDPGGRTGNQDPSAVEATGHLFRRRPFFDRQGGLGLPGMQHRQYFAGKEPHRFLSDRERNAAKAERGGELEIAHDAPP